MNNLDFNQINSIILNSSFISIIITNAELEGKDNPKIVYVNKGFELMSGYKSEEIIGKTPRILQGFQTNKIEFKDYKEKLKTEKSYTNKTMNYKKDGTPYFVELQIEKIFNEKGEVENYIAIQKDITDNIIQFNKNSIFYETFEQSPDYISILDENEKYIYVNKSFEKVNGFPSIEIIGKTPQVIREESTKQTLCKEIRQKLQNGESVKSIFKNKNKKGEVYYDEETITPIIFNNKIIKYLVIGKNIEDFLDKEKELEVMAYRDQLTGLYNRRSLTKYTQDLYQYLNEEEKNKYSLILLDIDYFKSINDKKGHDIGDIILKEMGEYFLNKFREEDKIFRYGGEEFLIILKTNIKNTLKIAEKIRKDIENKIFSNNINITVSQGVGKLNTENFQESFIEVDKALYKAKSNGRNQVSYMNY